jgi:hypothetical protein
MRIKKQIVLIVTLLLFVYPINAQADHSWTAFISEDSGLTGFKDQNGRIRIKPKFAGFTIAKKFDKSLPSWKKRTARMNCIIYKVRENSSKGKPLFIRQQSGL